MKTETKKTPTLRFPEFNEDWESKKLDELAEIYDGTHQTPKYVDKGVKFVSVENIDNLENTNKFITKEAFEKDYKIKPQKDDILMTRITAGIIGATAIVANNEPLGFYVSLALIRSKTDIDVVFLSQRINSVQFKHELHKRIIHVAFPKKINLGEIGKCNAYIPIIPEQEKIASFLTSIDKKIEQLTEKKDLLEKYKKGVMQKIFNQEIRFKDENGEDFADWEVKKFGEIFSFRTTNSFSREKLNYEDGEVKNIHYGDIHTKFDSLFDITKEIVPFIDKEISLKKISKDNYCKEGDLVIADASEDYADVGKCIEIINLNGEKVLAGLHTFLAKPDLSKMIIGFSAYLMKSRAVRLQVMTIAQGTKVLGISTGRLSKVKLKIPSEPEQQKIADFLSAIDDKINLAGRELEKTQEYKKGLLQQMFV